MNNNSSISEKVKHEINAGAGNINLKNTVLSALNFCDFYEKETGQTIRKGVNIRCPFPDHEDRNPSFSVNPDNGHFHCFSASCGKEGSVFDFYMERHGCDFKTALNELAEFAGIDTRSGAATGKTAKLQALYEQHCTGIPLPTRATAYLENRGLTKETIRHLVNSRLIGFKADAYCTQLKSRIPAILFPVFKASGKELVGLHKIFHEDTTGLDKEYQAGTSGRLAFFFTDKKPLNGRQCIVTESSIDALSVWQCVDREKYAVVSIMSSSTATKIKYLKSTAGIILCMDNDQAGKVARDKAGAEIGKCRAVCWTEADPKDMNDLLKSKKEDRIRELVETAEDFESPEPDRSKDAACDPSKPVINPGTMQFPGIMAETWEAIEKYNNPPKIFRTESGGIIIFREGGTFPVTEPVAFEILADSANWVYTRKGMDFPGKPDRDAVRSVISHPEKFPLLKKVCHVPVLTPAGRILAEKGYDAESGFYFTGEPVCLDMPVEKAREYLLDLVSDFCFEDEASRINALAALIMPHVLDFFEKNESPSPNILITAPVQSAGKTLLSRVLAIPANPETEARIREPWKDDADLSKTLATAFETGRPAHLIFDNIKRQIASETLDTCSTTYKMSIRKLGTNMDIPCAVGGTVRILNANNPALDRDAALRMLHIRLNPRMERPETRTNFRRPDIVGHAKKNRSEILSAVCSLIQSWIAAGKPAGEILTSKYTEFCRVIGGIIQNAGIRIPLFRNAGNLADSGDSETSAFRQLFEMWITEKKGASLTAGEVLEMIDRGKIEISVEGKNRVIVMGKMLRKKEDRFFSVNGVDYQIVVEQAKTNTYRLGKGELSTPPQLPLNSPDNSPVNISLKNKELYKSWGVGGVNQDLTGVRDEKEKNTDTDTEKVILHACDGSGTGITPSTPHNIKKHLSFNDLHPGGCPGSSGGVGGELITPRHSLPDIDNDPPRCEVCSHYQQDDGGGFCSVFNTCPDTAMKECQGANFEELAN